jgi:hypothetical protein
MFVFNNSSQKLIQQKETWLRPLISAKEILEINTLIGGYINLASIKFC